MWAYLGSVNTILFSLRQLYQLHSSTIGWTACSKITLCSNKLLYKILKVVGLNIVKSLQVLVQVPQKGCVITWDFDILKGDVTFTVLSSRRTMTATPHEHHVSGAIGGIGSTQYVDKHMTVGVDISIVEPPLVCRDGDSIQVGHISD